MGIAVERVFALHLSTKDPRIARSVSQLRRDIETHPPYQSLRLDPVVIRDDPPESLIALHSAAAGQALQDVDDPAAPDAIWLTTHHLIRAVQASGYSVALCVTGGPRLISLQAVAVASLLFRRRDHCWHLYTPRPLREQAGEGDLLHVTPQAGVRLIEVPLLQIGMVSPGLQRAANASPHDILQKQRDVIDEQELRHCRDALRQLSPRERDTVRAFAQGGRTVHAIAKELGITVTTVNQYKTKIFGVCREIWALPQRYTLTHHFLREKFGQLPETVWHEIDM
jgi:CRISPR-associated protein Csx14